jgi:hypothetical protein
VKATVSSHGKSHPFATFSPKYLAFTRTDLPGHVEDLLSKHRPVFFSYLSFRPEYRLDVVREGMKRFRITHSDAGFIWLGFPGREWPQARAFVDAWTEEERRSLLLLSRLIHDDFLTPLARAACLRSPACDGVVASVLARGIGTECARRGQRK